MEIAKLDTYSITDAIGKARHNDITSAKFLLEKACESLKNDGPFSPELRDYFISAFQSILSNQPANIALNLAFTKQEKWPDMANNKMEIYLAAKIQDHIDHGKSKAQAITDTLSRIQEGIDGRQDNQQKARKETLRTEFGNHLESSYVVPGMEQAEDIYNKWRVAIREYERILNEEPWDDGTLL